jgi:hypothetical protein
MTISQLQKINKCIDITKAYCVKHYTLSIILLIAQWSMYFLFAFCIFIAVVIPSDPVRFEQVFNQGISLNTTVHIPIISYAITVLKALILLFGLVLAIMGYSFGKIRDKNMALKNLNEMLEEVRQMTIG